MTVTQLANNTTAGEDEMSEVQGKACRVHASVLPMDSPLRKEVNRLGEVKGVVVDYQRPRTSDRAGLMVEFRDGTVMPVSQAQVRIVK